MSGMWCVKMAEEKKNSKEVKDGVPTKLLWYILSIPQFLHLFQNLEHAKNLMWHANERINDAKLRVVLAEMRQQYENATRNESLYASSPTPPPHHSPPHHTPPPPMQPQPSVVPQPV